MRRIAAVLLALMMLAAPAAMAMKGEGYPTYDGRQTPQNGMGGLFGEEKLLLDFDPSAEYSYLRDDYIQGCFFAFDAAEEYYLELYMLLPEKIQAGDVLTPQSCYAQGADSCSITLFEVDEENNEQAWFAGQLIGGAYPENSSFAVTITQADYSADSVALSGSIEAVLCELESENPSDGALKLQAEFSFELLLGSAPAQTQPVPGLETPAPFFGMQTPAFTLPPDHISL